MPFDYFLRLALIGAVCSSIVLAGCDQSTKRLANEKSAAEKSSKQIRVVVTVGMVGDIIRAVGGEHVQVFQLLGSGVDPHLYKANRDDVRDILRADIVFYSGLMLEGKMAGTLDKVARSRPVFPVTASIPQSELLGEDGDSHHPDPHVWMDPTLWRYCVQEVCDRMCEFDPEHASHFQANTRVYLATLEGLDGYARKAISSIPDSRRVFVTSHDAFQYFGRAYELEVLGIQGLSTESEAGLKRVNDLVAMLSTRKIPAVFFESSVPRRSIEALIAGVASHGHRLELRGPMYSDAMGMPGTYEGTYIGMIDHNVTLLTRSLGGDAPQRGWQGLLEDQSTEPDESRDPLP